MAAVWLIASTTEISWLYNNVVGTAVSVAVGYAVSLATQDEIEERETAMWPYILIGYFVVPVVIMLVIGGV